MIRSMTGYGKCNVEMPGKRIKVEIRSLNSKQFDAGFRLPHLYREKESEIRLMLISGLERGKVELSVSVDTDEEAPQYTFNRDIARAYYKEIKTLAGELGLTINAEVIGTLVKMPDVLKAGQPELSEEEWEKLRTAVNGAIESLNIFREHEGGALEKDLINRVNIIQRLLGEIKPFEDERIGKLRERLNRQFEDLQKQNSIDANRFEQEIIYYLEKFDINEEKVRLEKHCAYFLETMQENGSNGKKLSFISQEMGREINTLGSKANDADIQRIVVLMKDELEKIKEQLFNIL